MICGACIICRTQWPIKLASTDSETRLVSEKGVAIDSTVAL